MKEFGFYDDVGGVMLNEQIEVTTDESVEFLISNSPKLKAQIYAPEISFYLKNSADSVLEKSKNALLLYEARASVFDGAKDIDYEKKVGKNVVIISNGGRENLENLLRQNEFKTIVLNHFEVKFLYGAVGELSVIVLNEQGEFEIDADFVLIENARDYMLKQSGCIEISDKSDDEILKFLSQKTPNYKYKSFTTYDQSICQYHERRHEICSKCAEVCPSVAILKDDEKKHLVFSHIDCINCGECVSICPSGALDLSLMPRDTFFSNAKLYKDKTPLILLTDELNGINVKLPSGVLPFGISSDKFLNETHLLSLLQESGSSVIIYPQLRSRAMASGIDILNQVYELKFNKRAIYTPKNEDELKEALLNAGKIDGSQKSMSSYALPKREIFANRLSFLVGNDDLGVVYTDGAINYGKIHINRDTCTLCLSCVGACNVNALIADQSDNSIKFNPSVCTACGYCELSCAEKDTIVLKSGKLELKPQTFEYYELAKDELFKCIECGKEFATKKAVEKIAQLMAPRFASQPDKVKTLYCCADCKAKVMIKAQLAAQSKGEYYE